MKLHQFFSFRLALASFALFLSVLIGGCHTPAQSYHETLYVFGTLVDIDLPDGLNGESRKALTAIRADFTALHRHLHAWKPGELLRLNESLRQGRSMTVSPMLLEMTRRARQISLQSKGFFNPAIGALIDLWGFHTDTYPVTGPAPARGGIEKLLAAHPGMQDLRISENSIASDNSAVQLDYGGIAKGFALDRAIAILRRHQVQNAMVNAGGDLRAIGHNRDRPWRVGIRNPFGDGIDYGLILGRDESVMTSGNYTRYHEVEGRRLAHIIDPNSGYPIAEIVSATVITDGDATLADAAATALMVAGSAHWREVLKELGLDRALLVDADGNLFATARMFHRLLRGESLMVKAGQGSIPAEK